MKKIFPALLIAFLAACSNENEALLVPSETYSVIGYSQKNVNARTYFYEDWLHNNNYDDWPKDGLVFLWNDDDAIWVGSEKSTTINIEEDESAIFGGFSTVPSGMVYYNMTSKTANEACVLANQNIENNLGENGDFGYATLDDNGCFTLSHATSYVWFDVVNLITNENDEPIEKHLYLESITLNADGVNIAGKAKWDDEDEVFSTITDGQSKITLTVKRDITLDETLFPMVIFPADLTGKKVKVIYKFKLNGETKYFKQELPGKVLTAGTTQLVFPEIFQESDLTDYVELRVLTFEDEDAKFTPYYIEYADKTINTWSDLIDEEQHGGILLYGPNGAWGNPIDGEEGIYNWYDQGNTELMHQFPYTWSGYNYYGGGHAISNYASEDYETYGDAFGGQLTVYGTGGHSGKNFCMHFGYIDYVGYVDALPTLCMGDGIPRVINHMYVNVTTYVLNCLLNGNNLTNPAGDNNTFYITATGYDENDEETGTVTKYIWNPANEEFVLEWTKWDLTPLGKVLYVKFNVGGTNDNGYGFSQPAYFAYDDVAVQFTE